MKTRNSSGEFCKTPNDNSLKRGVGKSKRLKNTVVGAEEYQRTWRHHSNKMKKDNVLKII
jgi:hypothetical protein